MDKLDKRLELRIKADREQRIFRTCMVLLILFVSGGSVYFWKVNTSFVDPPPQDVLRLDVQGPLGTFDPIEGIGSGSEFTFPLLYTYLGAQDEDGEFKPILAKSWTFDSLEKRWKIVLNDNAEFHDGNPITAEDVKYSIERSRERYKSAYSHIVGRIEILRRPQKGEIDYANHPVGSGPFKFKGRTGRNEVALVSNSNYFHYTPQLKEVIISHVPDKEASWRRLLAKKTDFVHGLKPEKLSTVRSYEKNFYMSLRPEESYCFILSFSLA